MEKKQSGEASSINTQQPKFFKIIISQHECTCLSIPVAFVSRYGKNLQSPVYLEVPDGEVWEVEIVHSKSQIWLTKGWQDFCDHYSISCGHFLMFGYNGLSHFDVTIFDLSASEIEYPCNAAHVTCQEHERDQVESDDLHFLSEENRKDGKMHKQQCKIVHDKNKRVIDKDKHIANQRAKAFKSENPFIPLFMQLSYVSKPYNLSVPFKFARKYFFENCGDLVLRIQGRGSWSVKCTFDTSHTMKARLHSGWREFVLDNKLKFSDVCVLEVIEGTKLIDVTIFPASGSTSVDRIDGRKVSGFSESSVPCSQSKIVQTKKLKQQQRGCSYGFSSKIKEEYDEGTEIEELFDGSGHCPLGQGSKRRRPEEEAEDDVSIDIHTKSIKVEESQEDEPSPSFTRKTKRRGESCRLQEQQTRTGNGKSKMALEKGMSIAYQRAKDFKSENQFMSLMQPSYLSKPYDLYVPREFAMKYLLENCGDLVLRIPGKGSWSVKCTLTSSKIRSGWKAFVLDNKLKSGDVCVFEVIKGTKLIDVTIFPAAGSTPVHKIADRKVTAVSNNFVPCSQSTIVHTEKLKKCSGSSYGFNSSIKEEYGEGTEVENAVEILGHCPLGQGRESTIPQEKAGDDISIGIHSKRIKVGESREYEASPFARKIKKSRKSSRKNKKKSKISKAIMEKERSIAYRRAKDFKSDKPFLISFMQPSYVSSPYVLTVKTTFAQKYFLHEDCEHLEFRVPGRGSWPVRCYISENAKMISGWKAFVLDNKLKTGDSCVLEVIEATKLIDVTIFPAVVPGVSDSVPCSQSKMVHAEESKQRRGDSYGLNPKIKEEYDEGTEIEEPAESLGHCRVGQDSKRKRVRQEEENDVSIDNRTKSIKLEESQEDEASPSFPRKTIKSRESSRTHKQQSKTVYDRSKMIMEKERSIAYQRAKHFKSENPFIISFMEPSYLSKPYLLNVSSSFAHWDSDHLELRVPGRGSWPVRCSKASNSIYYGWKAFVLDNKLKVGDVCVFEVINGGKLIDVTIFPEAGSTSMRTIAGQEVPGESCSKHTITAYQRAIAFTSENPFFICSMQPSYVSSSSLTIPWAIASKVFPARHNNLVVQVPNKRSWSLKCTIGPKNAKLISGWNKFVLGNNIQVGDVCVFEQVCQSKLLFNVIIFRAAEQ